MPLRAKVLFLGACRVGSALLNWWGIGEETSEERALIYVEATEPLVGVDLKQVAEVWRVIARNLTAGFKVGEAVDAINEELHPLANWHFTVSIRGNRNARLKPRVARVIGQ